MADSAAVTTAGSFSCTHQGKRTLTSDAKLTVDDNRVVGFSTVGATDASAQYAGCTANGGPCKQTIPTPADLGRFTVLTVDGDPVLLGNLAAITNLGSPVTVDAGQAKLTAFQERP